MTAFRWPSTLRLVVGASIGAVMAGAGLPMALQGEATGVRVMGYASVTLGVSLLGLHVTIAVMRRQARRSGVAA